MKVFTMIAVICAAVAVSAVEMAVSPMKINILKEGSFDDEIISGIAVPGCSADFPLNGKKIDASGFNCAVMTIEAAKDGVMPEASDLYLNLRSATKGTPEVMCVGAYGRKAGEIYFYFDNAPADTSLVRLYLDYTNRNKGKNLAFKIKSLNFSKVENSEIFFAYTKTTINNCIDPVTAGSVFSGKVKNNGCSVIFFPHPKATFIKNFKFSKAEVGYTSIKEKLSDEGVEFNPRHANNTGVEVRDPDASEGKFLFTLDEPFTGIDRIFFYFNRNNVLNGKEVQFKINYIALIP